MDLSITQAEFSWPTPVVRIYVYPDGTRESFSGIYKMSVAKTGCHIMSSQDENVYIVAPGYRYIIQHNDY
jgi:hypothetical protein